MLCSPLFLPHFTGVYVKVLGSCLHNYDVVKKAAEEVRNLKEYKDEKSVQVLRFSDCWVRGFLNRANLHLKRPNAVRCY
jgi:hypothetical protein